MCQYSFNLSYDQVVSEFERNSIPYDMPGFCDHPNFIKIENKYPNYLNNYATFVAKKSYSENYLRNAKSIIDKTVDVIYEELLMNGRLGACIDITQILSRILEMENVWSCCIKGSLTKIYPTHSNLENSYYWSVDTTEIKAGHAWLFAPPYKVIDITLRRQKITSIERSYVPEKILCIDCPLVPIQEIELVDIINPYISKQMKKSGLNEEEILKRTVPFFPNIFDYFPPMFINGSKGAKFKYIPVAVYAPDSKLDGITNMMFGTKTAYQIYIERLQGKFQK